MFDPATCIAIALYVLGAFWFHAMSADEHPCVDLNSCVCNIMNGITWPLQIILYIWCLLTNED